jgi:hypothetical protein
MSPADARARDAARAAARARFPEIAAITDQLEPGSFRVLCIHDHAGNLLAGREPDDFVPGPPIPPAPTVAARAAAVTPAPYRGKHR